MCRVSSIISDGAAGRVHHTQIIHRDQLSISNRLQSGIKETGTGPINIIPSNKLLCH